jgi:hypothetical protein
LSTLRKLAVQQGRAMIRVRYKKSRDLTTVAVCPGCWNIRERRMALLRRLDKMELEVVFKDDYLEGVYRTGKVHAPACPYKKISPDPWERFKSAMGKSKSRSAR